MKILFTYYLLLMKIWMHLLYFLCVSSAFATTEATTVYQGSIGNAAISVELDMIDDQVFGRYFYDKYRKDTPLTGSLKNNQWVIQEGMFHKEGVIPAQFFLERTSNGFTGTWQHPKTGKHSAVTLRAVVPPNTLDISRHLTTPNLSLFDYIRLAPLKKQWLHKQRWMQQNVQWYTEPHSGIRSLAIAAFPPSPAIQHINVALEKHFGQNVNAYYSCIFFNDWQHQFSPSYLSSTILSFEEVGFYFCGGAHPNTYQTGYNFDARTGEKISLSALLGKPESSIPTWLRDIMNQRHPTQMRDKDCNYQNPEVWQLDDTQWVVTSEGIKLFPNFTVHVFQGCSHIDWAILPLTHLAPTFR